jgi:hypothetical protein
LKVLSNLCVDPIHSLSRTQKTLQVFDLEGFRFECGARKQRPTTRILIKEVRQRPITSVKHPRAEVFTPKDIRQISANSGSE